MAKRRIRSQSTPESRAFASQADGHPAAAAPAAGSHHSHHIPVWLILGLILLIELVVVFANIDKWKYRTVVASAKEAMAEGRWSDALKAWDQHGKNYPGAVQSASYRTDRARSRMGAGDYKGAIDDFNFVLGQLADKKKSADPGLWSDLANCQAQLGETDKALETYQKVLKLDPTDVGANLFIGRILLKKGKILEAAAMFQAIPVEKYPEDLKKDWKVIEDQYIRKAEEQAGLQEPTTGSLRAESATIPATTPAATPNPSPAAKSVPPSGEAAPPAATAIQPAP